MPVVSYLSGGRRFEPRRRDGEQGDGRAIPTFTISVTEKKLNEKSEALGVAKHPRVQSGHRRGAGTTSSARGTLELIAAAEFPVIDTSCSGAARPGPLGSRARLQGRADRRSAPTSGSPGTRGSRSTSSSAGWTRFPACRWATWCGTPPSGSAGLPRFGLKTYRHHG